MRLALARMGLLVLAVSLVPLLLAQCAKQEAGDAAELAAPGLAKASGRQMHSAAAAPGMAVDEAAPEPLADRNGYYASTYDGGSGDRDRVAKLVADGVVVDGKKVQLAAFTRQYGQAFSIPTKTALALSAQTEQGSVVTEGGKTYLQVGLQAAKKEAPRRPPLNLAIVIDRSGSMGDEGKLDFAKQAAERAVELLAPTDRLAVVVYDTRPSVAVPSAPLKDKSRALSAIRSLSPGDSTDIYSGLRAGYAEVAKALSSKAVNTVLLLSDGCVTAGESDPDAFKRLASAEYGKGVQTTTIGMGLDFSEDLMMAISRAGKGNFHFVRDAEAIGGICDRELGDLTHVVAKAVMLRVVLDPKVELVSVLGSRALEGAERDEVRRDERTIDQRAYEDLGITRDRQHKPEEPGVKMLIPHFFLGDSHVVLLEVRIPPGRQTHKVADVYVEYKDLLSSSNRKDHVAVSVSRAKTKADMVASTRKAVRKNRLGFETGEALLRAARLLADGRTTEAVKAIDERMAVLGLAAREWEDADLNRDHELLGRYQRVLASMSGRRVASSELGSYLDKSLTYSGYELTR